MANGAPAPVDFPNLRFSLEGQTRVVDDFSNFGNFLVRGTLGRALTSQLTASLGYAQFASYLNSNFENDFSREHRPFQQITFEQPGTRANWTHRFRLEQRFFEYVDSAVWRSRYFLRYMRPLYQFDGGSILGLSLFDEIFFNLNSPAEKFRSGFELNRIFVGAYWQVGALRFELGYINQYASLPLKEDTFTHILASNIVLRF